MDSLRVIIYFLMIMVQLNVLNDRMIKVIIPVVSGLNAKSNDFNSQWDK